MSGAEQGEVRLVPVSRDQRDALAADYLPPEPRALVAAWDAAVPGVGDSSWVEMDALLDRISDELAIGRVRGKVWDWLREARLVARAAAGGEVAVERSLSSRADAVWTVDDLPQLLDEPVERPSVSLRETIETHLRPHVPAIQWEAHYERHRGSDPRSEESATDCLLQWAGEQIEREEREAEEGERDE